MSEIWIPKGSFEAEFTEKKSRFICRATRIESTEQVKKLIKEYWEEHPGARHIVYAYALGDSGDIHGMTDDGEPHGTAGRPMLEVLKGSGLTETLVVSIRYFGGVKLGTGGLVSAYTQSAQMALEGLPHQRKIIRTQRTITIPYGLYDPLKRILAKGESLIENEEFAADITLTLDIPEDELEDLSREITGLTKGSVSL